MKEFSIPTNVDPKYIKVYVNDKAVSASDYSYNGSTGAVAFKEAPAESSVIKIDWRGKSTTLE